jgi:hypothetical protein
MDESTQQILALAIVAIVIVLELLRRRRRSKAGKASCDGCETGKPQASKTEVPLTFYKRHQDKNPPD